MKISLKHRLTACLLAAMLLLTLLPTSAWAADIIDSGTCGEEVTWTLSGDGVLTISGKGEMSWIRTNVPWGKYYQGITKVVIKSGVTNVGYTAFENYSALTSVSLPNTILTIGSYAFKNCTALTSITIPGSVTSINTEAFHDCTALKSVTISDGVTSINTEAFRGCTALKSITIPDSVTSIGERAFMDCTSLSSVKLPNNLTEISNDTFANCTALSSITLPDRVTSIGERAFEGCSKLSKISLPEGLTTIGKGAFNYCSSLTCITIPDSVTSIGTVAFQQCSSLSRVDLPKKITVIGEWTFNNCTSLHNIRIPDSVTSIGKCAFKGTALTSIYIPDGVTSIGEYAFAYCPNLQSVRIPTSVNYIDVGAFYDCDALTDVYYSGYEIQWNVISWGTTSSLFSGPYTYNDDLLNATRHYNWTSNTPAAPKISSSIVASSGAIKLSWSAVSGAEYYNIYRSEDGGKTYSHYASTSKTSYTNTGVTPGKNYYYKVGVEAVDGAMSDYSNVVSRVADCARPVVKVSNVASSGAIKLTWDKVTGASKYEIYRSTDGGKTYSKYTSTTSTSWTNKNVTPGKTYYYKVKAICGKSSYGNSAYSAVVYRAADCARPVVKISNVSSTGKLRLTWSAVDGASKYEIYRSTDGGKTYSKYDTTTSTSYTNTSVTPGKTYYYKVKAICGKSSNGNSAYSTVVSRTADCAKPVVTIQLSGGKPQLKWKAIDGASKYYIYRSTDGGKTYSCFTTVTATTWTNKSAKSGTTYYYKVKAICSNTEGNSAYSNVVSIKSK